VWPVIHLKRRCLGLCFGTLFEDWSQHEKVFETKLSLNIYKIIFYQISRWPWGSHWTWCQSRTIRRRYWTYDAWTWIGIGTQIAWRTVKYEKKIATSIKKKGWSVRVSALRVCQFLKIPPCSGKVPRIVDRSTEYYFPILHRLWI
jgi:hypothetical protein